MTGRPGTWFGGAPLLSGCNCWVPSLGPRPSVLGFLLGCGRVPPCIG